MADPLRAAFIGIAGLIGCGKSTLAKKLGEELYLPAFYEDVDNNAYLKDFYADQAKYAFALQVSLLTKRFAQHQQITWGRRGGVQDRTPYEDRIFAKALRDAGKMSARDYDTYCDLADVLAPFMKQPTLIIYLRVKPEESLERIRARGREMEAAIPLDYLARLYAEYEKFIVEISKSIPVIVVNYSTFRPAKDVAKAVRAEWSGLKMVKEVEWKHQE